MTSKKRCGNPQKSYVRGTVRWLGLTVTGAFSQWADTMRMFFGFSKVPAQCASSAVQRASSASIGAPWERNSTGGVVVMAS